MLRLCAKIPIVAVAAFVLTSEFASPQKVQPSVSSSSAERKPISAQSSANVPLSGSGSASGDNRRLDSLHIAFLTAVNQQLDLANNPWSVLLGGMGLLFTVGAIVAGLLLFRQSKDFREQRDKTLADAYALVLQAANEIRAHAEGVTKEMKAQAEIFHAQLASQINQATDRADKTTGDVKKEVQRQLADLRELKASVEAAQKALNAPAVVSKQFTQFPIESTVRPSAFSGLLGTHTVRSAFSGILGTHTVPRRCAACGEPMPPSPSGAILAVCQSCGAAQPK